MTEPSQPVFYYDLGSPLCYLAAEEVAAEMPVQPEWEPVLWNRPGLSEPELDRDAIELRASVEGLQPIRWPAEWPPDSRAAMLAATYAKRIGRVVGFSLAAFRQAFAGGRDLGDENTVLIAGAACEMHPVALLKALESRSNVRALAAADARAREAGVTRLPAVQVEGQLFEGVGAVRDAARQLDERD